MLKRISVILVLIGAVLAIAAIKENNRARTYSAELAKVKMEIENKRANIARLERLVKEDPRDIRKAFEELNDRMFLQGQYLGYTIITRAQEQSDMESITECIKDSPMQGVKVIKLKSLVAKKRTVEPLLMFKVLDTLKQFPIRIISIDFSHEGTMNIFYELYGI